jgi:hypothetical protein
VPEQTETNSFFLASPGDKLTPVYYITALTVYLPGGTGLEAHSGLADLLNVSRYVGERDRGAAPHIYEVELRGDFSWR